MVRSGFVILTLAVGACSATVPPLPKAMRASDAEIADSEPQADIYDQIDGWVIRRDGTGCSLRQNYDGQWLEIGFSYTGAAAQVRAASAAWQMLDERTEIELKGRTRNQPDWASEDFFQARTYSESAPSTGAVGVVAFRMSMDALMNRAFSEKPLVLTPDGATSVAFDLKSILSAIDAAARCADEKPSR